MPSPARKAAMAYAVLFALLFLQFPLQGALPGNCDTWLNGIVIPNHVLARVQAAVMGGRAGSSFYPETGLLGFGESAIGVSAIFGVFRLLVFDDVIAYYLFIVTLYATSAFGAFLVAQRYTRANAAAFFAGLMFGCSNYVLGNIDSPHTSFFFVAFLSLRELLRFLDSGATAPLLRSAALAGLQAYFSAYVFLFLLIALALVPLAHPGGPRLLWRSAPRVLAAAALGTILAVPFFGFYVTSMRAKNFANPWSQIFLAEVHSLEPPDLIRTLQNNRLWFVVGTVRARDMAVVGDLMTRTGVVDIEELTNDDARTVLGTLSTPADIKYFVYTRRCAYLGLVLYGLALVGLWVAPATRRELVAMYVVFFVIALGPVFVAAGRLVAAPMFPAYALSQVASFLRVPSRAFSFSTLAVVLAAGQGLERVLQLRSCAAPRRRRMVLAALALVALLENVPIPMKAFEGRAFARPDPEVMAYFRGAGPQVILDLPSRPGGALYRDSTDLFEWNRELIYMNHQTYLGHDVVNGVHGYFTRTRLDAQKLVNALPAPQSFAGLRRMGVSTVVYHRYLELPEDRGLLDALRLAPELAVAAETPRVVIFRWRS